MQADSIQSEPPGNPKIKRMCMQNRLTDIENK